MFRHVVLFRWADHAASAARDEAVAALRDWADAAAVHGEVRVGTDAGLPSADHDVVVVADFADQGAYERYAADEAHVALVRDRLAPLISNRAAVQHSW